MAAAMYQKPASIIDLAQRLADLGYWPVPIPLGCKGPTQPGWQNSRHDATTIPAAFHGAGLVGILHTNVLALDIDVYDKDLAEAITAEAKRRFPSALERIGQAPKSALFFRMEGAGFKVASTARHEHNGLSGQVEVRSCTRQIVAYGVHPETGHPYRWPDRELWATPWAELPEAKREDIEQFRDWCEDRLRKWAGVSDQKVIDMGLYHKQGDTRPSPQTIKEALQHIPASCGYDEWLEALMALHDYYNGSQDGLALAHEWSAGYPHYTAAEVNSKWSSFEAGKGRSYKSLLHAAKGYGADLSAMARRDAGVKPASLEGFQFAAAAETAPEQGSALEWFDDVTPALQDEYLIKDVLSVGALSVVYGPSNTGKTFFVLDLVYHIAAGLPWRGRRVIQAGVLYLAAEGGRGILNRISAIKKNTETKNVPFALRRAGMDLLHAEADLQAVVNYAEEVKSAKPELPLVIVVDTLSRVMAGGDENAAQDMTALIKNIDAIREITGAHVLLVHHTGKDVARGARGHSSLKAATDTEIELEVEGNWRAAIVRKQREYEGGEEFAFALKRVSLGHDQDGDEVTSCVVVEANEDAARKPRKLSKIQAILAETFDQMRGEGVGKPNPGGIGFPEPGRFWCIPMDDFRTTCEGKLTSKNTRDAFLRAFDALNGPDGIFCMASGFVWRTDKPLSQ